jgi:hypothetical protein
VELGQQMPRIHAASLGLLALAILISNSAAAQDSSAKARSLVAEMQRDSDGLIQKFPRMSEVDAAIRNDCETKNEGRRADSDFCRCASAVTLGLWRSGADPQMVPRLAIYLNSPNASAASLMTYQGPELYSPICGLAGAPSKRKR